jgi:hypothetical protein
MNGRVKYLQKSQQRFNREITRRGSFFLILSTCMRCGERRLVSKIDGSVFDWEEQHQCRGGRDGATRAA